MRAAAPPSSLPLLKIAANCALPTVRCVLPQERRPIVAETHANYRRRDYTRLIPKTLSSHDRVTITRIRKQPAGSTTAAAGRTEQAAAPVNLRLSPAQSARSLRLVKTRGQTERVHRAACVVVQRAVCLEPRGERDGDGRRQRQQTRHAAARRGPGGGARPTLAHAPRQQQRDEGTGERQVEEHRQRVPPQWPALSCPRPVPHSEGPGPRRRRHVTPGLQQAQDDDVGGDGGRGPDPGPARHPAGDPPREPAVAGARSGGGGVVVGGAGAGQRARQGQPRGQDRQPRQRRQRRQEAAPRQGVRRPQLAAHRPVRREPHQHHLPRRRRGAHHPGAQDPGRRPGGARHDKHERGADLVLLRWLPPRHHHLARHDAGHHGAVRGLHLLGAAAAAAPRPGAAVLGLGLPGGAAGVRRGAADAARAAHAALRHALRVVLRAADRGRAPAHEDARLRALQHAARAHGRHVSRLLALAVLHVRAHARVLRQLPQDAVDPLARCGVPPVGGGGLHLLLQLPGGALHRAAAPRLRHPPRGPTRGVLQRDGRRAAVRPGLRVQLLHAAALVAERLGRDDALRGPHVLHGLVEPGLVLCLLPHVERAGAGLAVRVHLQGRGAHGVRRRAGALRHLRHLGRDARVHPGLHAALLLPHALRLLRHHRTAAVLPVREPGRLLRGGQHRPVAVPVPG